MRRWEVSSTPVRDEAGDIQAAVTVFTDREDELRAAERLRESEAAFRRAQEAGGVGLFTVRIADDVLLPTPEFCRLYGLPERDSYPAKAFEELIIPEDAHLVSTVGTRERGEAPRDVEYRIRRADDGMLRWIARKAEIISDEQGRPARFSGVSRDITEQRNIRAALAASEERYHALFETIDEGFCVIRFLDGSHGPLSDYVHVEANPAYERHTGIAGIVGQTIRTLAPDEADGWVEIYRKVLRTGQAIRFEREFVVAGRHIEVAAHRVEPADRREVALLFNDITARVLANREQQQTGERQAALFELSETLREGANADAIALTGAAVVGRVLRAGRVGYGSVTDDGGTFTVEQDWTAPEVPSLAGSYRMDDYGAYAADLRQGRTVAIGDIRADSRTAPTAATLESVAVRALLNVPVIERGRLAAVLYVNDSIPRNWTDAEVAFARQVVELVRQTVERRRAEEQQGLLNHELSHRLKNTLAMVQAIAAQTLRKVSEQDAVEEFGKRVQALASAHDVLLQQNWASAQVRTVVEAVLGNLGQAGQVDLDGPDLPLGPRATLSLSLLLHELATNAVKYGALSREEGRVGVDWRVEGAGEGATFVMDWRERGGPPVRTPERRGFGSRLIRTGLVGAGGVELRYPEAGVEAEMRAMLGQMQAM